MYNIYIYIYVERERDVDIYIYMYIYIYIRSLRSWTPSVSMSFRVVPGIASARSVCLGAKYRTAEINTSENHRGFSLEIPNCLSVAFSNGISLLRRLVCNLLPRVPEARAQRLDRRLDALAEGCEQLEAALPVRRRAPLEEEERLKREENLRDFSGPPVRGPLIISLYVPLTLFILAFC